MIKRKNKNTDKLVDLTYALVGCWMWPTPSRCSHKAHEEVKFSGRDFGDSTDGKGEKEQETDKEKREEEEQDQIKAVYRFISNLHKVIYASVVLYPRGL